MRLKNLNGTSDNRCSCGSWLKHYEKFMVGTKLFNLMCSAKGCLSVAQVGAHVQRENGGNEWFIVPLCNAHNLKTLTFDANDSVELVSANIAKTCGN